MKRGYLWLDWVELGCRGWDLEPEGAALDGEDQERCHPGCYAHLDRTTLQLLLHGCREWQAKVSNDLLAAGLFVAVSDREPWVRWTLGNEGPELETTFTASTQLVAR